MIEDNCHEVRLVLFSFTLPKAEHICTNIPLNAMYLVFYTEMVLFLCPPTPWEYKALLYTIAKYRGFSHHAITRAVYL